MKVNKIIDITNICNKCLHEETTWNETGSSDICDNCHMVDGEMSNFEQGTCRYCNEDSDLITPKDYSYQAFIESNNTLQLVGNCGKGAEINYCPMCGRKLGN